MPVKKSMECKRRCLAEWLSSSLPYTESEWWLGALKHQKCEVKGDKIVFLSEPSLVLEWGWLVHALCHFWLWAVTSFTRSLSRSFSWTLILWQVKVWIPITTLLPPFNWHTPFPLPLILWSSLSHSAQPAGKKNRNLDLFNVSVVSSRQQRH